MTIYGKTWEIDKNQHFQLYVTTKIFFCGQQSDKILWLVFKMVKQNAYRAIKDDLGENENQTLF